MSYSYSQGSYLIHYGVKGQKHGHRRYQNEDGTLTQEGRIHYGVGDGRQPGGQERLHGFGTQRFLRGKALAKEKKKVHDEEYKRMKKSSRKYKETEEETERLEKKYKVHLEEDNPFYSDETMRRAKDRYFDKKEDLEQFKEQFHSKANKKARQAIIDKYGDKALDDIRHYKNLKDVNTIIAGVAGAGLFALFASKYGRYM